MSLVKHEKLSPFVEFLGVEIVHQGDDRVATLLPPQTVLQNRKGDIHGGVLATLLDTTLGMAARGGMEEQAASSTLSLTVNYLSPARGELLCNARCVRRGRSIRFVEGQVTDNRGEVVATAIATFKVFATNNKSADRPRSGLVE
ncbi:PaaI family thioesterase [Sinorhizobium meliloti]|uniref:Medium/long-chain acyl-CoA thioesterase YigI n=1 Tax=Rhizobium meliloti TaxID=382 RepID=A0A2J0YUF2_RHIML|nr:PaaI family thioesterase [Sinorhizobium meliloti]PJR09877.1 phenylacetic acid degradation protein [Sinorhizobium meliloti]